jgi:hypothetical protein
LTSTERHRGPEGRSYCGALADRLAALIEQADDPLEAMDEIAKGATRGGLILDEAIPRRTSAVAFVMDLLTQNPAASDWMNCRLDSMKPPHTWTDIDEVVEHLL